MGYVSLGDLLSTHGGQVDTETLRAEVAVHLHQWELFFQTFTEPTIIAGPGIVGTRTSARPAAARIIFLNRWDIAAYAALADETPVVLLSASLPFAFQEFFGSLLATPHVYKTIDTHDEQPEFDKPPRNYLHLTDAPDSEEPFIARLPVPFWRIPVSTARQSIATEMAFTALLFLLLHEIAHIKHGHLELINQLEGTSTLAELQSDSRDSLSQRTGSSGWYFEYEADVAATVQAVQINFKGYATRFDTRKPEVTNKCRDFLFSLGMVFLVLGYADGSLLPRFFKRRNATILEGIWYMLTRLPRLLERRNATTHPPLIGRMHFALWNARKLIENTGVAKEHVRVSASEAYEDLRTAANLLGIDQQWTASFTRPELHVHEALQTLSGNEGLVKRLEVCRHVVEQHYYRHGKRVSKEEYLSEQPEDFYGVRGQTVGLQVDDEWVQFEFPHENDGPDAFVDAARIWERAGLIDTALTYLQTALNMAPKHSAARQFRDRLLGQLGDHRRYAERFLESPGMYSHFADDILDSVDLSDPDDALPKLDCVTSLRPRQAGPLAARAHVQLLRAEWRLALEDCTSALAMGLDAEQELDARVDQGNALVELRQIDEGLDAFGRALDIDPDHVPALANRGIALQRHGRSKEALVDFERVLELAPNQAEHYFHCAAALRSTGRLDAAIRRTTQAIEHDTNNPKYYVARAQAHGENGNLEATVADLDTAIGLEPHNPIYRYERVTALAFLGRMDEAETELDAIVSNPEWVTQLAAIYLDQATGD